MESNPGERSEPGTSYTLKHLETTMLILTWFAASFVVAMIFGKVASIGNE